MDVQKISEGRVVTIYDIAKEAGVSASTVSRVLTKNANVSQEKKDKVHKLIEKYNFKPNALAKGLADTKSKIIGIIASDVRNPYYAEVFVACEVAAREAGYTVLLCNSLNEKELEEIQLEKLQEQRVDVIIQLGGRVDELVSNVKYVEKVNKLMNTIPVVVTGKLDGTQCYQVQIDAMQAMDLLMEYLISLNHTKIALVGGQEDVLSTFEKRQRYKQMLYKHQITFRQEFLLEDGDYNYNDGYEKMNKMLDQHTIPTAVIAINDYTATGIIRSILEHGYKIPDDISVVSFDNTYIAEMMIPKLTSVDYNYKEFGKILVETAIAAVEKKMVPKIQMIQPTLVVRETSNVKSVSK